MNVRSRSGFYLDSVLELLIGSGLVGVPRNDTCCCRIAIPALWEEALIFVS